MSIRARNILVTGANRGIGLEIIQQLVLSVNPPDHLFATCRDPAGAKDLHKIAKAHPSVHIVKLDVRHEGDYAALVETIRSTVGDKGLNMVINNAGMWKPDTLDSVTRADLVGHLETNTVAPLFLIKSLLPLIRQAAKTSKVSGLNHERASVFNITSSLASIHDNDGQGDWPRCYAYRSSKCALNMITVSLHRDLSKEGILVMCIHPGWVQTALGGPDAQTSTLDCVKGLFKVMVDANEGQAGKFKDFEGHELPW